MMRDERLPLPILAAAYGCVLALSQPAQAAPSYEIAQRVARSVVEITAARCSDGTRRIGTGFIFEESDQIVTANHVVAGCADISLWYERVTGQPRKQAALRRVLVRNDLALLTVNDPPESETPLRSAADFDPNADLKAIGYAVGQPTLGDLDLRISIGSDQLEDMLPTANRQEISRNTSIDLHARIYRFSRPLYHGMSGGPIFNERGEVVAIAAGGLESGAVAASWGWPARLLSDLLASNDRLDGGAQLASSFFTFSERGAPGEERTCGGLVFSKIRTELFGKIAETSDNLPWLEFMVNNTTIPRAEIEAFQFDVWVHQDTGATVVVPAGRDLVDSGGFCVSESVTGPFGQIVWAQVALNDAEEQAASIQFENFLLLLAQPYMSIQPDAIFGWQGLQVRADDLKVNRKAVYFVKSVAGPQAQTVHMLETVMARGGSFVGVVAANSNLPLCFNGVIWDLCAFDPAYIREWARFALATQMSTYPIY